MSNDKVKIYKNPERNKTANYQPYVPQYQVFGLEPEEYKSPALPTNVAVAKSIPNAPNPRLAKPAIRQPYAENIPSPVGRGKGPVPNVGNNMEHTWSSVDGEIIDDISPQEVEADQSMIDNNDYVTDVALGLPKETEMMNRDNSSTSKFITEDEFKSALNKEQINFQLLNENDYVLLIEDSLICNGSLDEVQEHARALVFGEHELCDGNPVPIDDIVVLKRVKIKIGLFLE